MGGGRSRSDRMKEAGAVSGNGRTERARSSARAGAARSRVRSRKRFRRDREKGRRSGGCFAGLMIGERDAPGTGTRWCGGGDGAKRTTARRVTSACGWRRRHGGGCGRTGDVGRRSAVSARGAGGLKGERDGDGRDGRTRRREDGGFDG